MEILLTQRKINVKYMIKAFHTQLILLVGLMLFSIMSFALTFSIVPDRSLPTSVPQFGSTTAYYKVTNTTNIAINNNFVKSLPLHVTQTTCLPNYCGATFHLGPQGSGTDSCILKLTVKGPVDINDPNQSPLIICTEGESNCDGTNSPLNVTEEAPSPLIGIGTGSYSDSSGRFFPLVVTTNNNGAVWNYPRGILDNLNAAISPNFFSGELRAAVCSASLDKSVCTTPGYFCNDASCTSQLPLIAVGTHNTDTWFYPASVFQDLQSRIDPNFKYGILNDASCTGYGHNAFCIASGDYYNSTMQFPLLALSSDGGQKWSYPSSIFQNLKTSIDPDYSGGFLLSASCNPSTCDGESVCIASGAFCSGEPCYTQRPLVALSTDKGKNWTYPSSIFKDIKTVIDPTFDSGLFVSSSCRGSGNKTFCLAAGEYFNSSTVLPLLAQTKDGGNTWSYPSAIYTDLPARIGHGFAGGFFNAASCTGAGATIRCIAAGSYYTATSSAAIPFLALTKDGGQNWSYPPAIYTKLKTLVDPNFRQGTFYGATCTDRGNHSICIAAGEYCIDKFCTNVFPLVALTTDGGKTWSYPSSVHTDLTIKIDPNFLRGFFSSVSCTGINANIGTEGDSFCVASGQYSTDTASFPLVAYSNDNGMTWFYPPYVFQNLTTTINSNFVLGSLNKTAASGGGKLMPYNRGAKIFTDKLIKPLR